MLPLFSPVYSIPYLVVAAILILLIVARTNQKKARIISSLLFIIFFGTRGLIGWDWQSYYPMFRSTPLLWDLDFDSFFVLDGTAVVEPGFTLYLSIMKTFIVRWEMFILLSTLIDWFLLDCFIRRYSVNYAFSILVYFCLCLGTEIDLLRNVKALLIFLLAIKFIEERKLIYYSLLTLLAITLHYSALLFIPLYFIGQRCLSKNAFIIVFIIANIIYIIHLPLMSIVAKMLGSVLGDVIGGKLDNYSSSTYVRGITIGYFFKFINSCLIIWKYNEILKCRPFMSFFLILYLIMIFVTFAMNDISSVSERIENLFIPVCCVIYPILIKVISLKSNKRVCLTYLFMFLCLKLYSDTHMVMYNYNSFILTEVDFPHRQSEYGTYAYRILNN